MSFTPTHPVVYYLLLACCLVLGPALAVVAWRRPRQRQRWVRLLASLVAAGALWLMVFPPMRPQSVAPVEAILLTEGYQPDTLRQLLSQLGAGTPVWQYGLSLTPAKARPLASLLTLAEQQPALRRVHVLGQGLAAAELSALGKIPVQRHQAPAFTGFRTALWNQKLMLGEVLRVEGAVDFPESAKAVWVGLRAAGTVRDSVRLPAGRGTFRLRYQPKGTGLVRYELLLRRNGQLIATAPVPVEITAPMLPAILLLTAAPSFEFKFLKNYLAEAHYPVALRTSVSRGLVQTDVVNQPAANLARLTPAVLARYSIVVADAPTLAGLPGSEVRALQTAVEAGRLGLLLLAAAAPVPRAMPGRPDFTVLPRTAAPAAPQALTWPDAPTVVRAALPAQLRPAAALRALVTGPGRALVAASRRVGLGFVVVSVVPETFQWGLQGHPAGYASFWNRLLTAATPPAAPAATWREGSRWPRLYQPLTLHLTAPLSEASPVVVPLLGGPPVRLALRQDTRLPEWSTAQFWPVTAGWHQVRRPGRTTHNFYIYAAADWQGPELREREQALTERLPPAAAASASSATEPWPATWFFVLFLLAAGYLWLEEKL